jgi:putative effector of murein hydrolase
MILAGFVVAFFEAGTAATTAGATTLGAALVILTGLAGTALTEVFLEILSLEGVFAMAFL